jgi:crossover junction endodeoxyribonuclease RuvC
MMILGIDPGIRACGVAVVSLTNARPAVRRCTTIRTTTGTLTERLQFIADELRAEMGIFSVDVIGLEDQQGAMIGASLRGQNTAGSVAKTARVEGIVHGLAAALGVEVIVVTPSEAKRAVGCTSRATKAQIKRAVHVMTREIGRRSEHATDAMAVAIAAGRKARLARVAANARRFNTMEVR